MDDNEREALRLVKETATVHDEAGLSPWLIGLGTLAALVVGALSLHHYEPCFFARVQSWMSAESSARHCVWQAECVKDWRDEGFQLAFELDGPKECRGFARDVGHPHHYDQIDF